MTETGANPLQGICGDPARYDRGECNWPKCGCKIKDEARSETAEFRVSRNRSGRCLWWRASEAIPLEHTDIRPATEAEADLMRRILTADAGGRMPALSLGERLGKLMEGKVNDDE